MDNIKVLIADDHAIVRKGLSTLLEANGGIDIVGEAENGSDAVKKTLRRKPDLVIMDLMMPEMDGIAATAEIKRRSPETKVLVLTSSTVSYELSEVVAAGADGVIMKSSSNKELLAAIKSVAEGNKHISREIADQISHNPPAAKLTPRQQEILASVARGLTNKDISLELGIRADVVNLHVMAILEKIGAANRTEAVAIAFKKHLLKI